MFMYRIHITCLIAKEYIPQLLKSTQKISTTFSEKYLTKWAVQYRKTVSVQGKIICGFSSNYRRSKGGWCNTKRWDVSFTRRKLCLHICR